MQRSQTKFIIPFLAGILCLLMALPAAAMTIIDSSDDTQTVTVGLYSLFTVEIAYNPTVGAQVSGPLFSDDTNAITLKEEFVPDDENKVGSPGKQIYLMQAVKPVSSELSWRITTLSQVSQFRVTLNVTDPRSE